MGELRGQESGVRSQEPAGEEIQGPGSRGQEPVDSRAEREALEKKVHELVAENQRMRAAAEAAERSAAIRAELQRLGVAKIELAYRAVKDDIYRGEDGRLMAQGGTEMRDYVAQFVEENPELLPARIGGGSGASAPDREADARAELDWSRIRPGMDPEEMNRLRQEIARGAARTLRG